MRADPPSECEEYLFWALPEVRRAGHFQITLATGHLIYEAGAESLEHAYIDAHTAIVSRLLTTVSECRLFGAEKLSAPPAPCLSAVVDAKRWRSEVLRAEHGRWHVAINTDTRDHALFWWWLICSNTGPLLVLPPTAEGVLTAAFAHSFDPVVVGNVGAAVSRSALTFVRRCTTGDATIPLLLTRTVHGVALTVFASRDRIASLFEMALQRTRRTAGFVALHCTDWVRPMELGSPALWTKLNASRDDGSILVDALRQARDMVGYDERTTLNALVAAELVSAIFGQPPSVFYGKDPKIDDAVSRSAKRLRERRLLPPEAVDLARDVVRRIAAESPLPNRVWRSERRRRAWRKAIADLESRLAQALKT